jgi:hypothetical protein
MIRRHLWPTSGLYSSQTWVAKRCKGRNALQVKIRFDDDCRNGHMSFAITADYYEKGRLESCGCLHEDIAKWFPELVPLIKWHLVSTDYPLHYVANTVYHADQHGPTHAWVYYTGKADPLGFEDTKERVVAYKKAEEAKRAEGEPGYRIQWDEKTAKTANFDHARSSAVWPEATDAELSVGKESLTAALTARLPALMAEFRKTMTDVCGFDWKERK